MRKISKDKLDYYDVIIVGGGPAGSTAGYLLSNFGFKVLIVDKTNFPRKKLCGGLITYKTLKLLNNIFNETESSLKKNHILNFQSNHYEVFYKNKPLVKKSVNIPFYFVDRYVYDNFLLKKAKRAGAEIIEGEEVIDFDLSNSEVITASRRKLKAKFIIGADGANSIMRKSLLKRKTDLHKWQYNLGTALEISIDRDTEEKAIDNPIVFLGFVNWGYSWIFPNRDKLKVGLGGLNRKNNNKFLYLFNNFLKALNLKVDTSKIAGHPVPYGNFLLKPVLNNLILIGDAAGFVDPMMGEGIFYAQKSAELTSRAIYESVYKNEVLETSYLQLLRKYVYNELVNANKVRWLFFNFYNKLGYYPMKMLLDIMDKSLVELVHGVRSYRWLKKQNESNRQV